MAFFKRHDGMSMSGMDESSSTSSMMMSTLHGGLGDTLWFDGWTPATAGATFGACVGLLFLAIFSRLLAAVRRSADSAWRHAALDRRAAAYRQAEAASTPDLSQKSSADLSSEVSQLPQAQRPASSTAPPFIAAFDVPRGLVQIVQSFIGYMLMLAVMTFNAWYFIAILLGIGLGEVAFGRFGLSGAELFH